MKKYIRFLSLSLSIVLIFVSLAACHNTDDGSTNFDLKFNIRTDYQWNQADMAQADNGYYFMNGLYLYFLDKATLTPIALCDKPNCSHDKETDEVKKYECKAYMGNVQYMAFQNNYLYLLVKGQYGPPVPYSGIYLRKLSPQGEYLEDVYQFSGWPDDIALHRGNLYYSSSTYTASDEGNTKVTNYLIQASLTKKEEKCLYVTDFINGSINNISPFGGFVYFGVTGYNPETHDPTRPETVKTISNCYCYNLQSGEIHQINQRGDQAVLGPPAVKDNQLLYTYWFYDYSDERNRTTYRSNPDGTGEEVIWQAPHSCFTTQVDEQYFYLDNWPIIGEKGHENDKKTIWVYDENYQQVLSFDLSDVDGVDYSEDATYRSLNITQDYLFFFLEQNESDKPSQVIIYIPKKEIQEGKVTPHSIILT